MSRYTSSRTDVFVHEVVITEGTGEGNKYLYNLDTGEAL